VNLGLAFNAVAKRNSGRRARPRKRRSAQGVGRPSAQAVAAETPAEPAPAPSRAKDRGRSRSQAPVRGAAGFSEQLAALGERPQAPWHPLPLSELLILVGMIGTIVGVARGAGGRPLLFAGIGSIAIGTIESTLREHLSGYRPHTTLLAFVPTALIHSGVAVGLAALHTPPAAWVIAPLALDVPVFAFLFKLLRGRFLDARHERALAAGR
jgi:hypothetical protein